MGIDLFFLESDVPLTKEFSFFDGEIAKSSYPMVRNFNSHKVQVSNLEEFREAVIKHADRGHCLIKGQLDRPLVFESRAGRTDKETPTQWMLLDVDGLPFTPQETMRHLGLEHITYFVQYSSSSGLATSSDSDFQPKHDRYHIFFLLEDPTPPQILKEQLMHWNLNIPAFAGHLHLSSSKNALSYPLDITVCQNDKLIYIAPPICNKGVIDTLKSNRIGGIVNG